MSIEYFECPPESVPMALLLEADPSEESIYSYLAGSWCFVAKEKEVVLAVCVVKPIQTGIVEIFNVGVLPERQQQGIGSVLLRYTLQQLRHKGGKRVELGTGSFGYQLTYYQRLGFRVDTIVKDHFLLHYSEPIFEHGIQHKDMLRLALNLEGEQG